MDNRKLLERINELKSKLNKLQNLVPESIEGEIQYSTNITTGKSLYDIANTALKYEKRDCCGMLEKYLYGETEDKVCALYGLRQTGKTTLIRHLIQNMSSEDISKTVYIKINPTDTMAKLNFDMKKLCHQGYKYIFIDEITLMQDFIDAAAVLSDVYCAMGMKIVLSGADSLGFWFAANEELYNRVKMIPTTFISFREYARLLHTDSIDEYIRYGGILHAEEFDFDNKELPAKETVFNINEWMRRYIDTAVSKNIQHSLVCCKDGGQFRHLYTLYEAKEFTGAINRVIEDMNYKFVLEVLTRESIHNDLKLSEKNMRSQSDSEKHAEVVDAVIKRLSDRLEIRGRDAQKIGITRTHIEEIKEYLKALDLIYCGPVETTVAGTEPYENIIFTQPSIRYCQAQVLVYSLMNDNAFSEISEYDKCDIIGRILDAVRGRMMKDIVLLETSKAKRTKKVFRLQFDADEFDMVVYDSETNTCKIYDIQYSREVVHHKYIKLFDEKKCLACENKYGKITERVVIYQGESYIAENGVQYINAEEYLKAL